MITITDLAARHGLTLRALRFYEQKGLISPQRQAARASTRKRMHKSLP
jgi:DNA-binding transcriptional MerR regulator